MVSGLLDNTDVETNQCEVGLFTIQWSCRTKEGCRRTIVISPNYDFGSRSAFLWCFNLSLSIYRTLPPWRRKSWLSNIFREYLLMQLDFSTTFWVVLAPPIWECEEIETKRRTIIDLIQRRCLFLFYIRIIFIFHAVIRVVMENISAANKFISGNFHFESILYFL